MKILNIINLIGILLNPIVLDRYKTLTNNSGKLLFDGSQISYVYSFEDIGMNANVGIMGSGLEFFVPTIFKLDIIIQLNNPVEYANVTINLTNPATSNYYLNYIVENARVISSSRSQLKVQLVNTDKAYISLWFTLTQLQEDYGYDSVIPMEYGEEWVINGQNYINVGTVTLDDVTEVIDSYIPKLNSIIQSVDGVEGMLNTLINNTDEIANIDTNIQGIKNTLDNILIAVNNIDNQIDTITWKDINVSYLGYSSGYNGENLDNSSGYHNKGYYYLSSVNINYVNSGGIFKLVIPLGAISGDIFNDWFFQSEIYQIVDGNRRSFSVDEYIVFQDRYKVTIYFTIDTEYASYYPFGNYPLMIYIRERAYYYSNIDWQLQYIPKDDIEYWTIYNAIKNQSQYNVIQNIESILNTVYNGDYDSDVTSTDYWFRNILQNIQLPNLPDMNDPKILLIPQLMESFTSIIDLQSLSLFKWVMSMIAIVGIFKAVTK